MNGELYTLQSHDAGLTDGDFSPDGGRIVTASEDATARVWEVGAAAGAELFPLRGHREVVTCASFSPDGAWVLTGSEDATLRLWPVAWEGEPTVIEAPQVGGRAAGAPNRVTSAAFSPDGGRIVATLRGDRTARVWNTRTEQQLGVSNFGDDYTMSWPSCAVFSPDGARIAIALLVSSPSDPARFGQTVRIWDPTGGPGGPGLGHQIPASSAAFSADGSRIVSTHQDATARVWDAGAGHELLVLAGHEGPVTSAAFSPDGGRIVTASQDATARLWDAGTGQELLVLGGHEGWVTSAAFSPDGGRIVTASGDTTARVWRGTVDDV